MMESMSILDFIKKKPIPFNLVNYYYLTRLIIQSLIQMTVGDIKIISKLIY